MKRIGKSNKSPPGEGQTEREEARPIATPGRTWEGKRGFGAKLLPLKRGAFHDGLCGVKANLVHSWAVERGRRATARWRWRRHGRQRSVASETERATRRQFDDWDPQHRSDKNALVCSVQPIGRVHTNIFSGNPMCVYTQRGQSRTRMGKKT